MKIAISSGHSVDCQGAVGYLNEVAEATRVVNRVYEIWNEQGIEAHYFHDTVSDDSSENLNRIVDWHNAQSRDLDVSVHFNAGGGTGSECLYVTQESLSAKVSAAMADAADWTDRGAKYRGDLFFLNSTEEPAILLEVCFVDSKSDSQRYAERFEEICQAIASSISGQTGSGEPPDEIERPDRPERPPGGSAEQQVVDIAIYAPPNVRIDVSVNNQPISQVDKPPPPPTRRGRQ